MLNVIPALVNYRGIKLNIVNSQELKTALDYAEICSYTYTMLENAGAKTYAEVMEYRQSWFGIFFLRS